MISIILFCFLVPALTAFIQECFQANMIFRRYYLWLTYQWIHNWRKDDRHKRWFLKPLGLCCYCQNTWLTIIFYLLIFGINWWLILSLGGTYVILKIYNKFNI